MTIDFEAVQGEARRMSHAGLRIAGAPITWGICEVPRWGYQLPADEVLAQMRSVGLSATELGADGYLPTDPAALCSALSQHELELVGGFVPAVLHDDASLTESLAAIERGAVTLAAAGSDTLVLAVVDGSDGYDERIELTQQQWTTLLGAIDTATDIARSHGLTLALHPHVGTLVERASDVQRVLGGSSVALCVDTGHLLIGGVDPVDLIERSPGRIAHVHLKDVHAATAERVRDGSISYADAVRAGLYRPLGDGDVDLISVMTQLHGANYRGWYVLEQDAMLSARPDSGEGPIASAARSIVHLASVVDSLGAHRSQHVV